MNTAFLSRASLHRLELLAFAALFGAALLGVFQISEFESLGGYLAVLAASALPAIIWIQRGGVGLPILPITALGYFSYYGVSIIAGDTNNYSAQQILSAGLTVALFLISATLFWAGLAFRRPIRSLEKDRELDIDFALTRLIFFALFSGLVFEIGMKADWWGWLGTWFGTFRSLMMSAMSVGCFLFGTALGHGRLTVFDKYAGSFLVLAIVILEISGLIMHTAIVLVAAVLIGFIISSRRIPWLAVAIIGIIIASLHVAEGKERDRFWAQGAQDVSVGDIPSLLTEWFTSALNGIGTSQNESSIFTRASQLTTLLLVEEQSPRNIPFLEGETYANFARMVLPRFLVPDKIASQENLHVLSVRYGLQRSEDYETTTIAWNIVPEGYANFGYPGVVGAGILFGVLIGILTWLTSSAPPISLRGLIGLASLVTLLDVEYDFSYLTLNWLQALISISLFYLGIKILELLIGKKVLEREQRHVPRQQALR